MFDVQVRRRAREEAVASIAAYYARVTTAARPMNRLVATVMVATVATGVGPTRPAGIAQLARGDDPAWAAWASLAPLAGAIGLAGAHTVPAAVRLGTRRDPRDVQLALARAILRDHLLCLAAISAVL